MTKKLLALGLCVCLLAGACIGGGLLRPAAAQTAQQEAVDRFTPIPTELPAEEDPHTLTLMVYMIGSDLEEKGGAAVSDLCEMAASGIDTDRVHLLVCTGGTPQWHPDLPDGTSLPCRDELSADENATLLLAQDGFVKVSSTAAASMGEPDTLVRFLNECYSAYPADRYALILWDHGSGPLLGYGKDLLANNDALTLPELREAMDRSPFGPDNKLAFLGFDACLMASAELAIMMADHADYLISSQETEPSFGWDYAFLADCGKLSERSLSSEIIHDYFAYGEAYYAEKQIAGRAMTLSCLDLSYAPELEATLNTLFAAAASDLLSGSYIPLTQARVATKGVSRASSPGAEYDLIDLCDLVEHMQTLYPDETAAVLDVLHRMLVCSRASVANCSGLNLYYPFYNKALYSSEDALGRPAWRDIYADLGVLDTYLAYLGSYTQFWLSTDMEQYFTDPMTPIDTGSGTYSLQLTQEQAECYADAMYIICKRQGKNTYSPIFFSRDLSLDGTTLKANFDGNVIWWSAEGGAKTDVCLLFSEEFTEEYAHYYTIAALGSSRLFPDSTCKVDLRVDKASGDIQVMSVSEYTPETANDPAPGKLPEVDLHEWSHIFFANTPPEYPEHDETGKMLPISEWRQNKNGFVSVASLSAGLDFYYAPPVNDGTKYYILIEMSDMQGNRHTSELLPLALFDGEPVTAPETPTVTLDWQSGAECTLAQTEDCTVTLIGARSSHSGIATWNLRIDNRSDTALTCYIADPVVDGTYTTFSTPTYSTAEPGQSAYLQCSDLANCITLSGQTVPHEVSFDLYVFGADTVVVPKTRYVINTAEHPPFRVCAVPFMNALADEQVLMESSGLRLTLLSGGFFFNALPFGVVRNYSFNDEFFFDKLNDGIAGDAALYLSYCQKDPDTDTAAFTVRYRLDNLSDNSRLVLINGMRINGTEFFDMQSPSGLVRLPALGSYTGELQFMRSDLEAKGITQIRSLELGVVTSITADDYDWYPVKLYTAP